MGYISRWLADYVLEEIDWGTDPSFDPNIFGSVLLEK